MTEHRGFTPYMRWVGPVLAALPGLWLAWQGPRAVGWSPQPVPAAVLAIVATAAIALGLVVERRLALWSLPAVGTLLWALAAWGQWFALTQRQGPGALLMVIVLLLWLPITAGATAAAGFCAYVVYRECRRSGSLVVVALLLLCALAMLASSCADYASIEEVRTVAGNGPSSRSFLRMLLYLPLWAIKGGLWTTLGLLGTLALGLVLARRHGVAAALLVVSSLPAWLDPFTLYFRVLRTKAYELPAVGLGGSLEAMTAMLAAGCLVLPALGVLVARSERARGWWLALPPLLALSAVCLLQGYARQRLGNPYGPFTRLTDWLVVVALWLPALLAATLYRQRGEPATGALPEVWPQGQARMEARCGRARRRTPPGGHSLIGSLAWDSRWLMIGGTAMKTKPAGELADRIRLQEEWVSSLGKRGTKLCLEGDDLSGIDLAGADLNGAELRGVVLDDADLSGADLATCVLAGCSFRRADLSGSLLAKSNADYTSFRGAVLRDARMLRIELDEADLQDADLSRADLRNAYMSRASLQRAVLRDADLSQAYLGNANLHGANLDGADLDGVKLGGADLSAVEGFATVRLGRVNVGTLKAPVWLEGAEARAWLERAARGTV